VTVLRAVALELVQDRDRANNSKKRINEKFTGTRVNPAKLKNSQSEKQFL
jgi:hypothetical protein